MFLARLERKPLGHLGGDLCEVEALLLQRDGRNLAAREVKQIVGELAHPEALFKNNLQQFVMRGIRVREIAVHQLGR